MPKTPSYRKRHDRNQAIVTLTDSITKRRRNYWLGPFGTAESRERYHRVIAEWEANDRRWPEIEFDDQREGEVTETTISTTCARFWNTRARMLDPAERSHFKALIRLLRKMYGTTAASRFGPRSLQLLREEMIRGDDTEETNRRAWSVNYTNAQVRRLCRLFKWAASQEIVSASVRMELLAVEPLKPGRASTKPAKKVMPVPDEIVEQTLPCMASPVRALVQLQRLTGARPSELLGLRRCDISTKGIDGVWIAKPRRHKTEHTGAERTIYLGPQAQAVL